MSKTLARAKRLRSNMTDAERSMWQVLRGHRFQGMKFRRQVPIGPYVADFLCHQARLIIEVDGSQHSESRDAARTAFLSGRGYRVLRFWNNEVLANPEGCLARIAEAIDEAPSPQPSPAEGRGGRQGDDIRDSLSPRGRGRR